MVFLFIRKQSPQSWQSFGRKLSIAGTRQELIFWRTHWPQHQFTYVQYHTKLILIIHWPSQFVGCLLDGLRHHHIFPHRPTNGVQSIFSLHVCLYFVDNRGRCIWFTFGSNRQSNREYSHNKFKLIALNGTNSINVKIHCRMAHSSQQSSPPLN